MNPRTAPPPVPGALPGPVPGPVPGPLPGPGDHPLADLPDRLELDLDGLEARVAALLDAAAPELGDGRIRDKPDARTLRYYQTLGLLDRPLRYDGRRALYGARHVLQAASVKLLQAQGLSLAQVQPALAGRSTEALRSALAAALPPAPTTVIPVEALAGVSGGQAVPAPVVQEPALHPYGDPPYGIQPSPLLHFSMAPGVALLVDPAVVTDPAALAAAVSALLSTLPHHPPAGVRP